MRKIWGIILSLVLVVTVTGAELVTAEEMGNQVPVTGGTIDADTADDPDDAVTDKDETDKDTPGNPDDGNQQDTEKDTENSTQQPDSQTPAKICKAQDLSADYDPKTKMIHIEWATENAVSVNVLINDVEVKTGFTGTSCDINYALQAGAQYTVAIVPIDEKGEEGEEDVDQISEGEFSTPELTSLKATSAAIKDAKGVSTGFAKPAVIITWEGQENTHYAIYRASKNQKAAYTWVATVAASKEGIYTYTDENAKIGKNYYKICQITVQDQYVEQEVSTALSGPLVVTMSVPKASLAVSQQEDGTVALTMGAKCDYVSGYAIYRKSSGGKYKKIAETSSNHYVDDTVQFGTTYSYKVRAFFSETATDGRHYGVYSKTAKVKNTVGKLGASVKILSSKKVTISWNKAANAKKYEIYYKTQTDGDSYTLLTTTKKRSITAALKKGNTYNVLIRAFCQTDSGKEFFSCVEITFATGFAAPSNETVKGTSYSYDSKSNIFVQKDKLSWTRVYGASGYYVEYYNPVTKNYEVIAKLKGSDKVSYTVSNDVTSNATDKQYRISAYYKTKVATGKTLTVTVGLDTVKGVKAKTSGTKTVVSWKGSTGAQQYRVYRSNGRYLTLIATTASHSFTDIGTSQGAEYLYYVQAVNLTLKLESALSEGASYTRAIKKVSGLKAVNQKKNKVKLTWPKASASEGYIIYYKTKSDDIYTKLAELDAKTTTYTHKKLEEGETYYYRIVSVYHNAAGIAAESSTVGTKVKIKK